MEDKDKVLNHINGRPGIQLDNLRMAMNTISKTKLDKILAELLDAKEIQQVRATKIYKQPRYYPKWSCLPSTKLPKLPPEPLVNTNVSHYLGKTEGMDATASKIRKALTEFADGIEPFSPKQVLDKAGFSSRALKSRPELRQEISIAMTKVRQRQNKAAHQAKNRPATGKTLRIKVSTQLPYRVIPTGLLERLRDAQLAVEQSPGKPLAEQDKAIRNLAKEISWVGSLIGTQNRQSILDYLDVYYNGWRALYKVEQPRMMDRQPMVPVKHLRNQWGKVREKVVKTKRMSLVSRDDKLVAAIVPLDYLQTLKLRGVTDMPTGHFKNDLAKIWKLLEENDAVIMLRYGLPVVAFVAPHVISGTDGQSVNRV